MALILCSACNKEISSNAKVCPHCGEPDPSRRERNSKIYKGLIMLIIIAGAIGYFWFTVLPDIREHGLFHQIGQRK